MKTIQKSVTFRRREPRFADHSSAVDCERRASPESSHRTIARIDARLLQRLLMKARPN